MNRITIYILFIFCSLSLNAQQDMGLHFMRDINQSNLTNPAIFNKYKITVSLPSAYANMGNSGFSFNDVTRMEGSTLLIDVDDLISQLDDRGNTISANVELHTFAIGIKLKPWQFTLSHAIKFNNHFNLPKGMIDFFWNGNGASIGEAVNIAPNFSFSAYQEFALGVGYKLNDMLSIGGRVKYLNGLGNLSTQRAEATITTNEEYYQLSAETDILINSAGIPLTVGGDEFFSIGEFDPQIFGDNKGFGVDLGATLNLGDRLTVSASILDIGQITWRESANNLTSNGRFDYEGLDYDGLVGNDEIQFDEIVDSIKNVFQFTDSQNEYSTSLPSRFYVSGLMNFGSGIQAGALIYGEAFQDNFSPGFALSVRKEFANIFSAGAVYGIRNGSFSNLGVNMALRLGGVQFFGLTDNILSVFNPLAARNANVRFGLNLAFGKSKNDINN